MMRIPNYGLNLLLLAAHAARAAFCGVLLFSLVLVSVPFGATDQVIDFTGFIAHPSEGPYNQEIHARVQIVRKDFNQTDPEDQETVVWEKNFSPVPVYNGTFNLQLDSDNSGRKINAEVFESRVDYEFDPETNQNRINRAIFPNASYALRLFFRRSLDAEEEQIKPDFNFDGSPFSVSSVPLSGNSSKYGKLRINYLPDSSPEADALVKLDPFANATGPIQHGILIENGSLEVQSSDPLSSSLDMEGAFVLRNVRVNTGTVTLSSGNIRLNSLCMAKDCDAKDPKFNNPLFVYGQMDLERFVDRDAFEATESYLLEPAKQSRITNLVVSTQSQSSQDSSVLLTGRADMKLTGQTSLLLRGASAEIELKRGRMRLDMPPDLKSKESLQKFRLQPDGQLGQSSAERDNFRKDTFHKVIADRMISVKEDQTGKVVQSEFQLKPSGSSKLRALQFRFEDKAEAMLRINERVKARYPNNPDRLVKVLFDPIITQDILDKLLKGDTGDVNNLNYFEFHQHDLIGQASGEELLEIINDPRYTDNTRLNTSKISNDLIKETELNQIWLGQSSFVQQDSLDSLFVRGNIVINHDSSAPSVLGGTPEEQKPFLGAVTSAFGNKRDLWFTKKAGGSSQDILNFDALGLRLYENLEIRTHDEVPKAQDLHIGGELILPGPMKVARDFIAQGTLIFGGQDLITSSANKLINRRTTNVLDLSAPIFFNRFSEYYSAPQTSSRWLRLEADYLGLSGPTRNVVFEDLLRINANFTGTGLVVEGGASQVLVDRINTSNAGYYTDPQGASVWNELNIDGSLQLVGDLSVEGDISIAGRIRAASGLVSANTQTTQDFYAPRFEDLDPDPLAQGRIMQLDPHLLSRLHDLTLETGATMTGRLQVGGNVTVGTELRSDLNVRVDQDLVTPNFYDLDNSAYVLDPNQTSRLNTLKLTSELNTATLSGSNLQIGQSLTVSGNATFATSGRIHGNSEIRSEIRQLDSTGGQLFRVDNDGVIYARSADVGGNAGLRMGEFSGTLSVGQTSEFLPESYFNNSDLWTFQSLKFINALNSEVLAVDSAGNLVAQSGVLTTGTLRFDSSSTRGFISATDWKAGSENASVRRIRLRRADGQFLDVVADDLHSVRVDGSSDPLDLSQDVTFLRMFDQNNQEYFIEPQALTKLRTLSSFSTLPVTVSSQTVILSSFWDMDNQTYGLDLEASSRLRDLHTTDTLYSHGRLHVLYNSAEPTAYSTKVSLRTSLSLANETIVTIADQVTISRLGHIQSQLDFLHRGSVELMDSSLSLGTGTSVVSIGKLSMTTLILLPPISYTAQTASTQPVYYADHLHQHENMGGLNYTQLARRDQDNTFLEPVRFSRAQDSVHLEPATSTVAAWATASATGSGKDYPVVLGLNEGFLVGLGETAPGVVSQTILEFNTATFSLVTTASAASLGLSQSALAADQQNRLVFYAGGLTGGSLSNQLARVRLADSDIELSTLPFALAFADALVHRSNLYVYGGYRQGVTGLEPVQESISRPSGLSAVAAATPHQLPADLLDSEIFVFQGNLYRSPKNNLTHRELLADEATDIQEVSLSARGLDVCYHTANFQIHVLNLLTRQKSINGRQGHSCRFGVGAEQDLVYFIDSASEEGPLAKVNRDNTGYASLGRPEIQARHLEISDNGKVTIIADVQGTFPGETLYMIKNSGHISTIKGDGSAEISLLTQAVNEPVIQDGMLFFTSSVLSSNLKENLFRSAPDVQDREQITFFPQGLAERPVILDANQALAVVSAHAQLANHLPTDFRTACTAAFRSNVYLIGAGAGHNEIYLYRPDRDIYFRAHETLPFSDANMGCTEDGNGNAYVQSQGNFYHLDLAQLKLHPLRDLPVAATGALGYSDNSVWFLQSSTGANSQFWRYNIGSDTWIARTDAGYAIDSPKMVGFSDRLVVFGQHASNGSRLYSVPANTWSDPVAFWDNGRKNPSVIRLDSSRLLLLGGSNGATEMRSAAIYDATANTVSTLPLLPQSSAGAGLYLGDKEVLMFGGLSDSRRLMIQPLNATDASPFSQIINVSLTSGQRQWVSSAPLFALASRVGNEVVYKNSGLGLSVYNPSSGSHTVIAGTTNVLSISGRSDSNHIYFSSLNTGIEKIYRILSDGSGLSNLSDTFLGTSDTAHRLGFVSRDGERIYFLRTNGSDTSRLVRGYLNQRVAAELLSTENNIRQVAFKENSSNTQKRGSSLLLSDSTTLSSLTTVVFGGYYLEHGLRMDSGVVVSARAEHGTTNLYFWPLNSSDLLPLTTRTLPEYAALPQAGHSPDSFRYQVFDGTQRNLVEGSISDQNQQISLLANSSVAITGRALSPQASHKQSFLHADRIYVKRDQDIYASQALNGTTSALSFSWHDRQPLLSGKRVQITQAANRVFFYDEGNRVVYQYDPKAKSLARQIDVAAGLGEGVLAASGPNLVFVSKSSVQGLSILTQIETQDSLVAKSSAEFAPETAPERLMAIRPDGRLYARRLSGVATIVNATISGGEGNQGIRDGSIHTTDINDLTLTESHIRPLGIESSSIASHQIPAQSLLAGQVLSHHLQSSVLGGEHLSDWQIENRHLQSSTLPSSVFAALSLTHSDFSSSSVQERHITPLAVSGHRLVSETLLSGNIKRDTLVLEDFTSTAIASKQILDQSLIDSDIQSLTLETRHFRHGSAITSNIIDLSVTKETIQSFTLTTERIEDQGIATIDIATRTVTADLLVVGAITSVKVAENTSGVSTDNIQDFAFTEDKFADDSIDRSKIASDAVTNPDIADFTITFRELGPGSVDTAKVINNSIINESLRTDALTIDKLADLSIDTVDIMDGNIVSRHFYEGGLGDRVTRLTLSGLNSRSNRAAIGIFENHLYVLGGDGSASGIRYSLMDGTSSTFAVAGLPGDVSVHASSASTLYIMSGLQLYGFDYNTLTLALVATSPIYQPQAGQRGYYYNDRFFVIGPNSSNPSRSFSYHFATTNWAGYNTASQPQAYMQAAGLGANLYYFGNGQIHIGTNQGSGWAATASASLLNREGSIALPYEGKIYGFGGSAGANDIFVYDPGSTSLSYLTTQNFSVDLNNANSNIVKFHQGRFYILGFSGAIQDSLLVWHPRLDASIDNRNLIINSVASANIKTDSLSSIVFSTQVVDSARLINATILNQDIENNVILSRSIENLTLSSMHFVDQSFTTSKIDTASVDARVVLSYSLEDSDFASSAITNSRLMANSIGYEEVVTFTLQPNAIAASAITLAKMANNSVLGEDIVTGQIQTPDLANVTITGSVIANQQLSSVHILDANLLNRHFGGTPIPRSKILTHTLLEDVFASQAVTDTAQILNESLDASHVLSQNLTLAKLTTTPGVRLLESVFATGALTDGDLTANSVTQDKILSLSLMGTIIESFTLDDSSFAASAITTDKLMQNSFSESEFASNSLTHGNFLALSLTNSEFDDSSIYGPKFMLQTLQPDNFKLAGLGAVIASNAITDTRILNYTISDQDIAPLQITSSVLAELSITGTQIITNTLISDRLADNSVTTAKIRPAGVSELSVANGAVVANKLRSGGLSSSDLVTATVSGSRIALNQLQGKHLQDQTLTTNLFSDNSIHGEAVSRFQITSDKLANLTLQNSAFAVDAITSSAKFATADVFEGFNFADRSIRGDSIVSYTIEHAQIGQGQILAEHFTEEVVGRRRSRDPLLPTSVTAVVSNLQHSGNNLIKIQRVSENRFFAIAANQNRLLTGSTLSSLTVTGLTCNPGEFTTALHMLSESSGFAACNRSLYYFNDLDTTPLFVKQFGSAGETITDLYFSDENTGLIHISQGAGSTYVLRTSNGGFSHSSAGTPSSLNTAFASYRRKVAFSHPQSGASRVNFSLDGGGSISVCNLAGTAGFQTLGFDQNNGRLYGVYMTDLDDPTTTSFAQLELPGCTVTSLVAFPAFAQPYGNLVHHGNRFFVGDTQVSGGSLQGFWEINLGNNTIRQISSHFQASRMTELPDNANNLMQALALGEHNFAFASATGSVIVSLDYYQHVQAETLQGSVLANESLTTGVFRPYSIASAKISSGSLSSRVLRPSALSHESPVVVEEAVASHLRIFSQDGEMFLAISSDSKEIHRSTDNAQTWNLVHSSADLFHTCIINRPAVICGSPLTALHISTDNGATFTVVTTTPFEASATMGWPLDSKNFLAFGRKDGQVLVAKYDSVSQTFVELSNGSGPIKFGAVGSPVPRAVHFFDGKRGLVAMNNSAAGLGGGSVFKTEDGGLTWSALPNPGLDPRSNFYAEAMDSVWIRHNDVLAYYNGTTTTQIYDFDQNIQDLYFLTPDIGIVALADSTLQITLDRGTTFESFKLQDSGVDIAPAGKGMALVSLGSGNYVRVQMRSMRQPFTSLVSADFNGDTLQQKHLKHEGLSANNLVDGALGGTAMALYSLTEQELAASTIAQSDLRNRAILGESFALGSLGASKLGSNAISSLSVKQYVITSDEIEDGSITSRELAEGVLTGGALGSGIITTAKIRDGFMTGNVLQDQAIQTDQIVDNTFLEDRFANHSFAGHHFTTQAISTDRLVAAFSMTRDKVLGQSLQQPSFAAASINSRVIADQSVNSRLVVSSALDGTHMAKNQIEELHWQENSILNSMLSNLIVTDSRIALQAVSADHIVARQISYDRFTSLASAVHSNLLSPASFTSREIGSSQITAGKLSTDASHLLTSGLFADDTVNAAKVNGLISEAKFSDNVFTTAKLQENTFVNSRFANSILNENHLAPLGLTGTDFQAGSINSSHLVSGADFFVKMVNDSITDDKIVTRAIGGLHLLNSSVAVSKLAPHSIFSNQLQSFLPTVLANLSVSARTIRVQTLTGNQIGNLQITSVKLANDTLTSRVLADDVITSGQTGSTSIDSFHLATNAITRAKISNGTNIAISKIQSASLTGGEFELGFLTAANFATNTIQNDKLAANSFDERTIQNGTITSTELSDGGISEVRVFSNLGNADFSDDAVTGGKIRTTAKLNSRVVLDGAIGPTQIVNDGITRASFADGSIGGSKIGVLNANRLNNSVIGSSDLSTTSPIDGNAKLANDAVLNANIADGAITNAKVNDIDGNRFSSGVTADRIAPGTLTRTSLGSDFDSTRLLNGTIDHTVIANTTLVDSDFAAGSVDANKLIAGSLPPDRLADNSITTAKIQDSSLQNTDFAQDSIVNAQVQDGSLTAAKISLGTVGNSRIVNDSLGWIDLANDAIGTAQIAPRALVTANISNSSMALEQLTAGSGISGTLIQDGTVNASKLAGTISGAKIATAQIDRTNLSLAQIAAAKFGTGLARTLIAADTLAIGKFAAGFKITDNAKLTPNSIGNADFAAASINPNTEFVANSLRGSNVNGFFGTGFNFADSADLATLESRLFSGIQGVDFANNSINGDNLVDGTFQFVDIPDNVLELRDLDSTEQRFLAMFHFGGGDTTHNVDGLHFHARPLTPTCPTGFTAAGGSAEFCISGATQVGNPRASFEACADNGARVCSLSQLQTICEYGSLGTTTYLVSEFTTTEFLVVTRSGCDFTGQSLVPFNDGTSVNSLCCMDN